MESVQGNRTVNAKKEMIMFSASDEKKDIQDSGKKRRNMPEIPLRVIRS